MQKRDAPEGDIGSISDEDLDELLSVTEADAEREGEPGRFIVVEGIDGTGKSHVVGKLLEHLKGRGIQAMGTSEPTESSVGRLIKGVIELGLDPYTELFLFIADRADHTRWIESRLREGNWIVCDRYALSSAAYQGTYLEEEWEPRGKDPVAWIMELQRPWWRAPDLTLLIVDDVESCLSRVSSRGTPTKFEKVGYLRRVQDNYIRIAVTMEKVVVVDTPDLEAIVRAATFQVEVLIGPKPR
jgi:dTMP kinase